MLASFEEQGTTANFQGLVQDFTRQVALLFVVALSTQRVRRFACLREAAQRQALIALQIYEMQYLVEFKEFQELIGVSKYSASRLNEVQIN